MSIIYADALFLLNAMIDYLLLLAAGRVAGEQLHRTRMALGALLGGGYAVAVFLPGLTSLSHPLCKAGVGMLMVLIGLGGSRRLLRQSLIFFALACAFGGGILAVGLLGQGNSGFRQGVVYSGMDLKIVLLSAAGCYVMLSVIFQRFGRHSLARGEVVPVRLQLMERQMTLMALVDTGNTLTDPVSGQNVVVAEGACLTRLFPPGCGLEREDMTAPAQAMSRLNRGILQGRLRLLPYRAVGVDCGLLLAVRVDAVSVGAVEQGPMLVALSPTPLSDGGGYRALVSRS